MNNSEILATIIEKSGLTKAAFARKVGASPQAVSNALRKDQGISDERLERYAAAAGFRIVVSIEQM